MTVLSRFVCTMIVGLLLGLPGPVLAQESCILSGDAELSSYVNRLADGIGKKAEIHYGQGDQETPEAAFVGGAIGARAADLFVTVQFNRGGKVTDFDVHRLSVRPVNEVLVHLLDECLEPYAEEFGSLAGHIAEQIGAQIAAEEERKEKLGL
jgi:hypothetical protein